MDRAKQSSAIPSSKSRLARAFAKILHIRVATGIAPLEGIKKVRPPLKAKEDHVKNGIDPSSFQENEVHELIHNRESLEALLAKIFASISSVKANYVQLQFSQAPYDADGIQSADQLIVSEMKSLSELKQCFVKKQFDISSESTLLLAEIQEQKSLLKTYEIMCKKMESQLKLKDPEVTVLKERLKNLNAKNMCLEKSLNRSGPLSSLDKLHLFGLGPAHFSMVLHQTSKSMRCFARLLINEIKSAGWDINAAASAIEPGVSYTREDHKCFPFESFICREMFDSFQFHNFGLPNEPLTEISSSRRRLFYEEFMEFRSTNNPMAYLSLKPRSSFAKFCRLKYPRLVHPKMERAFFGSLTQRNLLSSGGFPDTKFFAMFAEVARQVWLLHCLAFSLEPAAAIFQAARGFRFLEIYMETVAEEVIYNGSDYDPRVAFTVFPGFKIGRSVIQCKVYLVSNMQR
ncbi:hypothetical protein SAY87_031724 [Trapa incisa]|uniref:DUF641 domain-containing protein n=1 Tax=Trapa incisa TaxID=236973 RepID=A0AAN7KQ82_9MYRT|nr:hypothetical protein SAY87_031724 [Trapa incisa]